MLLVPVHATLSPSTTERESRALSTVTYKEEEVLFIATYHIKQKKMYSISRHNVCQKMRVLEVRER